MIIEVEIYKVVRKLTIEGMSQRAIAKKLGISRQTVKKYGEGDTVSGNRKEYDRLRHSSTPLNRLVSTWLWDYSTVL